MLTKPWVYTSNLGRIDNAPGWNKQVHLGSIDFAKDCDILITKDYVFKIIGVMIVLQNNYGDT